MVALVRWYGVWCGVDISRRLGNLGNVHWRLFPIIFELY